MCSCFQLYYCKVPFLFFFLRRLYLAKEYNYSTCSAIANNFQNLLFCATFLLYSYSYSVDIIYYLSLQHYCLCILCSYLKTFCIIMDLFPYGIRIYSFVLQYILQFILHFIYLYAPLFYSFHLSVYFDFVISVPIIHNAMPMMSTC